jgi:hypothetical protein
MARAIGVPGIVRGRRGVRAASAKRLRRTSFRGANTSVGGSRTVGGRRDRSRGGGPALQLAAGARRTADRALAQASNAAGRAGLAIDATARSQLHNADRASFAFDAGALPGCQRAVALLFTMPGAGRAAAARANSVARAEERAGRRAAGLRAPGAVAPRTLAGAAVARVLIVEAKRAVAGHEADRQQHQTAEQRRSHSRDARDASASVKRRRSARALSVN